MGKSVDDIARIVASGGGVSIDASRISTNDLVRIVSNAVGTIVLRNADSRSTQDLVRISASGGSKVILEL